MTSTESREDGPSTPFAVGRWKMRLVVIGVVTLMVVAIWKGGSESRPTGMKRTVQLKNAKHSSQDGASWRRCASRLTAAARKKENVPLDVDATFHGHDENGKETKFDVTPDNIGEFFGVTDWSGDHKVVPLGKNEENFAMLYSDNTVVIADSVTCRVTAAYASDDKGELHGAVRRQLDPWMIRAQGKGVPKPAGCLDSGRNAADCWVGPVDCCAGFAAECCHKQCVPDGFCHNSRGVYIRNYHSKKALDVPGGQKIKGLQMQQWDFVKNNNQKFQARNFKAGWTYIRCMVNGYVLDVSGSHNGAPLTEYSQHSGDNQQFKFVSVRHGSTTGLYKIVSKSTNKVVEVGGHNNHNGGKIQVWDWVKGTNQMWYLEYV